MSAATGPLVGVDVGGSKVHAVLLADGVVRGQSRVPTTTGADGVVASVTEAVGRLCAASGVALSDVARVGVALPGTVVDGTVAHAVNLGLGQPVPLAAELARGLAGRPVHLENDVNAAALGAAALLDLGDDVAFLALGTGVAAGLVLDGRLRRGSAHAAGEVGHLPYRPDGARCGCGQTGCLELYASGAAIARAWPGSGARHPAAELFDAATAGDPTAVRVRQEFVDAVATAVRLLVLTCDVARVVLGGGVAGLGRALLDPVALALRTEAARSPFLRHLALAERLVVADPGAPVAPVGAALAAVEGAGARAAAGVV